MEMGRRKEITTPPESLEQKMQLRDMVGCSDSPSANGVGGGGENQQPTEDEIAEKIFSWWISGKAYSKWYADEYLQMKLDFDEDEEENT